MADEIVIPVRMARANLMSLRSRGVDVSGVMSIKIGQDGVYVLHVEGLGADPFPAKGEGPRGES